MARVYVLGAGASRFAGFPLASDLWSFIQESKLGDSFGNELRRGVVPEIARALDAYPPKKRDQPDLEVLFTLLDLTTTAPYLFPLLPSNWATLKLEVIGTIVNSFLARHFDLKKSLGDIEKVLRSWADKVSSGDVIISFNWDLMQEIALWRAEKFHYSDGYGFEDRPEKEGLTLGPPPRPGSSQVRLYKLHGSVNWVQEDGDEEPSILRLADFFDGGRSNTYDEWQKEGSANAGRRLIIPSYLKTLRSEAFLIRIWNQAARSLRRATDVIVIGYSLPMADSKASSRIRTSLASELLIAPIRLGGRISAGP